MTDLGAAWDRRMRSGDWEAAWRVSDAVLNARGACDWTLPRHRQWLWDGSDPAGRRVMVRCYHGLGDTIQFARLIPWLRRRGAEPVTWAQPPLIPLLATLPGIGPLLPLHDGAPAIPYDMDVEVMELAHLLRLTPAMLPGPIPYLHPPPAARGAGFTVGLVWQAGDWAPERSVPVELLRPLAAIDGVTLRALQRGAAVPDWLGPPAGSDDALAAASAMTAMDLVISVDSMPAHLAGALGIPVWTLLAHHADWRWMDAREDTPWYPTMRLLRQPAPGDWASVVARVAADLAAMAARR